MTKLALLIEYDGTNYAGWQFQPNATSIQETIENALAKLFHCKISIIGAGRTDAGVHASGQVASLRIESDISIPSDKLPIAINCLLPKNIRIIKSTVCDDDFHARYSAVARQYHYYLTTRQTVFNRNFYSFVKFPFSIDKLFDSAKFFIGKYDFTSFSKVNPDTKSYFCEISSCFWEQLSENDFRLSITADRFVYGMVRAVTGAMIEHSRGKISEQDIKDKLISTTRKGISPLAPPEGLVLNKIFYDKDIF